MCQPVGVAVEEKSPVLAPNATHTHPRPVSRLLHPLITDSQMIENPNSKAVELLPKVRYRIARGFTGEAVPRSRIRGAIANMNS